MNILKTDRLFGLLLEVNAARHNLLLLLEVNAARHNLRLLLKVNAARHKLTTDGEHTYNMVEFLSKPAESKGFKQIVDFLNAHIIKYALTVNPTIYTLCIEQFWATVKAKLINGNSKTTAWNEFSSTMASAIICLATNQKFNFSKYIFESMVKNLDNVGNFLMYPRKILGILRRVGKGFSERETLLFQTMMVQDQEEIGEGSEMPTDSHHTPTIIQPSTSQPQNKQRSRSLGRAATIATGLDAEQDRGNIDMTQSKATLNESSSLGTSSGNGTRRQETMGDTIAQTRADNPDIDANEDIYLVNVRTDEDMFGVNDLDGDELIVKSVDVFKTAEETRSVVEEVTAVTIPVSAATTTTITTAITDVEMTLAQALVELKRASTYTNSFFITTITGQGSVQGLQEEEEEEERLAREKAQQTEEANIAWDDVQAKIEADYQLAQRLQAQEQEELTDEEKARLFVQFLEQRRKHFAAKRAEEKRNRPPTRAQQRSIMCTYLKNMEGWKPKNLKNKSFANIQELFDKAMKRVNTFVDYRTELVEEKEVAIDVIPLATKPPTIVDWKIHKEGKKSYYQIIRADGKSQMYRVFSQMLKSFSREDLEDLYKLVKAKYGSTRPVEDLDLILWGDLKTMFEPHVEDIV
ncbi:hypothetical protein Tco_1327946 [Tanacetum coccineum]